MRQLLTRRRCRKIKSCTNIRDYALENNSPHNEKCTGNSLPTIQATLSHNSEESFIRVERKKRAKYKQFFLSCIAESVNKGQIYSYLRLTLKITPNNISTFQSKRRGTISAEVSVSFLLCSSDVLGETFWPKHVRC